MNMNYNQYIIILPWDHIFCTDLAPNLVKKGQLNLTADGKRSPREYILCKQETLNLATKSSYFLYKRS